MRVAVATFGPPDSAAGVARHGQFFDKEVPGEIASPANQPTTDDRTRPQTRRINGLMLSAVIVISGQPQGVVGLIPFVIPNTDQRSQKHGKNREFWKSVVSSKFARFFAE